MKHFTETKPGKIKLRNLDGRLFSIKKNEDPVKPRGNMIRLREECDGYYAEYMTKEEAIELFQEAIDWIKTS